MEDVPEIDQPEGMLGWGGASNIVWWVNRELRVAGFFATQQAPFGNPAVTTLVNAWKKDFWAQFKPVDRPTLGSIGSTPMPETIRDP